jgi:hypothetical protein
VLGGQAPDPFHPRVPFDTIVVESPAPAIQPVFEFLLNLPGWIVGVAVLVGLVAGTMFGVFVWRRRRALRTWLTTRSRPLQVALATLVLLVVGSVAFSGAWLYDYTEHQNEFCNSCHIMNDAYMRFAGSEHADLGCHDCHRQSMYASVRQLVLWVAERPDDIPPHSPVPSEVCGECHLQWRPDTLWMTEQARRNIALTAGHLIHLESDHEALADVQCVTCHGQQVHRFIPVEATCLSSGCHDGLEIRLGRMAAAPQAFHCAGCHEFTAAVSPALARDLPAAQRAISPDITQCHGCHEMERLLPAREVATDPHEAACGLCHNPHTQLRAAEAAATCTAAGCHDAVTPLTPFHRGIHEAVLTACTGCHAAHAFLVAGHDCIACHRDIYDDRPALRPTRR